MSRRIMPVLCALMGAVMLGLVMANALMLNAHASDESGESLPLESSVPFELNSGSARLMEAATGRVIYQKDADMRRPVASVTKLMPLLLIFEALDTGRCTLDDQVTVSRRAESMGGSQALLDAGSTYDFEVLLKSITVSYTHLDVYKRQVSGSLKC